MCKNYEDLNLQKAVEELCRQSGIKTEKDEIDMKSSIMLLYNSTDFETLQKKYGGTDAQKLILQHVFDIFFGNVSFLGSTEKDVLCEGVEFDLKSGRETPVSVKGILVLVTLHVPVSSLFDKAYAHLQEKLDDAAVFVINPTVRPYRLACAIIKK